MKDGVPSVTLVTGHGVRHTITRIEHEARRRNSKYLQLSSFS